jgi:hydrogenase/urease accessory protein HupE
MLTENTDEGTHMHSRNWFRFALAAVALLTSASALAHPGHEHAPGLLAALNHAVIGWDQLVILLVVGGALAHFLIRNRK